MSTHSKHGKSVHSRKIKEILLALASSTGFPSALYIGDQSKGIRLKTRLSDKSFVFISLNQDASLLSQWHKSKNDINL